MSPAAPTTSHSPFSTFLPSQVVVAHLSASAYAYAYAYAIAVAVAVALASILSHALALANVHGAAHKTQPALPVISHVHHVSLSSSFELCGPADAFSLMK